MPCLSVHPEFYIFSPASFINYGSVLPVFSSTFSATFYSMLNPVWIPFYISYLLTFLTLFLSNISLNNYFTCSDGLLSF